MSLVGFALSEHCISSVEIIQHSQDSVALVEPGNQTENAHHWKLLRLPRPSYFCFLSETLISHPCDRCCCTHLPRSSNKAWEELLQFPSLVPSLPKNGGTNNSHLSARQLRAGQQPAPEPWLRWDVEPPHFQHWGAGTAVLPGMLLSPAVTHVLARAELWRK